MEWKNSTRGFLKGTVSRTFLNNSSSHGLIFLHRYYSIAHFLRILLRYSRDSAESKLITVQDSGAQFWDSDEILRQRRITIFIFWYFYYSYLIIFEKYIHMSIFFFDEGRQCWLQNGFGVIIKTCLALSWTALSHRIWQTWFCE